MITYVNPTGLMSMLSQAEVDMLRSAASGKIYDLYRRCSLAVLNCGSVTDNAEDLLKQFHNFGINVIRRERGVKLEIFNAPESAFVNGEIIQAIQDHLFSVLRDIVFMHSFPALPPSTPGMDGSAEITNQIFRCLRNAGVLSTGIEPNLVVCWGGHSIGENEYRYTEEVGRQLGLRHLDICTGCGPGAMEGPMKGATFGHLLQRNRNYRFIGLTEPSIIAAEPPNPFVTELCILPDMEKRLEAFARIGHAMVIFPGGPGTAEELFFLLGMKMDERNAGQPMPLILTGPEESRGYFEAIDRFIRAAVGDRASQYYEIVVNDPKRVADICAEGMKRVTQQRISSGDSFSFNWTMHIDPEMQKPLEATHEVLDNIVLKRDGHDSSLIVNLRKVFSGIVAGNVKNLGREEVAKYGPFKIHGERQIMTEMDNLLRSFVASGRMKLGGEQYTPCYELVETD